MNFSKVDRKTASAFPQGALMLQGDYGGHTWAIAEASHVKAPDAALEQLAIDLGATFKWSSPEMNYPLWVLTDFWDEWREGLHGDEFQPALWIHPLLLKRGVFREAVQSVLSNHSPRLSTAGRASSHP
jgi:hypothetical protein